MKLYLNTVSEALWIALQRLMLLEEFNEFRLVGGTSLSLQLGHRESIDIDLFTDAEYDSIDFDLLEKKIIETFDYVDLPTTKVVGMGNSYFIGNDPNNAVKLDLFYTDSFIFPVFQEEKIRFARIEEVAAMKLEVIANGGRKKDFWDIHELLERFTVNEIIHFYIERNPYGYSKEEMFSQLVDFSRADDDFTPNCYREKVWELIKIDIERIVKK